MISKQAGLCMKHDYDYLNSFTGRKHYRNRVNGLLVMRKCCFLMAALFYFNWGIIYPLPAMDVYTLIKSSIPFVRLTMEVLNYIYFFLLKILSTGFYLM